MERWLCSWVWLGVGTGMRLWDGGRSRRRGCTSCPQNFFFWELGWRKELIEWWLPQATRRRCAPPSVAV